MGRQRRHGVSQLSLDVGVHCAWHHRRGLGAVVEVRAVRLAVDVDLDVAVILHQLELLQLRR